jgi:uracil-DNA glycosylase
MPQNETQVMSGDYNAELKSLDLELCSEWQTLIGSELEKRYFKNLVGFLKSQIAQGKEVFPPPGQIFAALNATPPSQVKAVILGQDPYHGNGQAHGLSFSVCKGTPIPPSLKNIFKELSEDVNVSTPNSGDLTKWTKQGVLLLNTVLTVESGRAASHRKQGWETFTDAIIAALNARSQPIVFILWGAFAHKKGDLVRCPPHLILKSVHPSPLSAYGGFWGSKPFSKTNQFLKNNNLPLIDWSLL